MTDQPNLSIAHIRVLQALNRGGMLTEYQLAVNGSLTRWKARQVVSNLRQRKLITTGTRRGWYQITALGQQALTAGATTRPWRV